MAQQSNVGLNSREVLALILKDHHVGKKGSAPFKQRVLGHGDVAVYKGGFIGDLLGRPTFELAPLKTVTLRQLPASA